VPAVASARCHHHLHAIVSCHISGIPAIVQHSSKSTLQSLNNFAAGALFKWEPVQLYTWLSILLADDISREFIRISAGWAYLHRQRAPHLWVEIKKLKRLT
jgi:hypothetical protein